MLHLSAKNSFLLRLVFFGNKHKMVMVGPVSIVPSEKKKMKKSFALHIGLYLALLYVLTYVHSSESTLSMLTIVNKA